MIDLLASALTLQSKNHIWRPFKEADVLFPAHAAFAVLQTNELLLHLSAASGQTLLLLPIGAPLVLLLLCEILLKLAFRFIRHGEFDSSLGNQRLNRFVHQIHNCDF